MHAQQRKPLVINKAKFLPKKIEKKNSYIFQAVTFIDRVWKK